MPKRKRYQANGPQHDGRDDAKGIGLRQRQVEAKIVHGVKLLNRALKTARSFERQKLGKRQKAAKEKSETAECARLEAEVDILKVLDIPRIAEAHLIKTLLKYKATSSSILFPKHMVSRSETRGGGQEPAAMNVIARLYNSNTVKETLQEVLDAIYRVMGIRCTTITTLKSRKTIPAKKSPSEQDANKATRNGSMSTSCSIISTATQSSGARQINLAVQKKYQGARHSAGGDTDISGDFFRSDSDIVASSEKSSKIDNGHGFGIRNDTAAYSPSRNLSLSPSLSSWSSTPPPSKARARNKDPPLVGSTFLPTLTMGGYWSGSESGEEDFNTVDIAPRKNRRGQQARRAIWEKKYGKKANHLKGANRDLYGISRIGATGDTREVSRQRRPLASGANKDPVKSRGRLQNDEGPLHPSWIAAKKAREQKQSAPFEGKKVVFD